MTELNLILKCNKCGKFKTPYDEKGVHLMREHLKECEETPTGPPHTTIDKLIEPK